LQVRRRDNPPPLPHLDDQEPEDIEQHGDEEARKSDACSKRGRESCISLHEISAFGSIFCRNEPGLAGLFCHNLALTLRGD
jgi:hypothetical protein